jgi:hypothetical protein
MRDLVPWAALSSSALAVLLLLTMMSAPPASAAAAGRGAPAKGDAGGAARPELSGPYTHENLTVYLIHGPDRIDTSNFLTLAEAMREGLVVVHETGDVNELAIENRSGVVVYVQSGDIVKGGKQDRTIARDFICPPRSGRVPVASFCVEQGRWHGRGREAAGRFASADNSLAGKELKLAAKRGGGRQDEVWQRVRAAQRRLGANVGSSVQSAESETSLQLSLEDGAVRRHVDAYVRALSDAPREKGDVIGYAAAVNGRVSSADVYASSGLFGKMWPKLLYASAVEAVTELDGAKGEARREVAADDVRAFMAAAERGRETRDDAAPGAAGGRARSVTRDGEAAVMFDSRDPGNGGESVHREYIAK